MHLWPVHTGQTFHIVERSDQDDKDINIIDTLSLQQINTYIVLTKKRILIYQGKPFVPVLIYDRSDESLNQFGVNQKLHYNNPLQKVSAVNDNSDTLNLNENCIFYVQTGENCLLVYEIKTFKNWVNTFKIYGIEPRFDNEAITTKQEYISKILSAQPAKSKSIFHLQIDKSIDSDIDDELLTVFDLKNSGKIIQNGYIIEKGKNLVQIMKEMFFIKSTFHTNRKSKKIIKNNLVDHSNDDSKNQEAEQLAEEMPIKSCDVSLKTVLKFDNEILDMKVFTKYTDSNVRQELIYLLYTNELCILTLNTDYTLSSKHIVSNTNNYQLSFNGKDMFIASFDENKENLLVINKIDKKNNVIYSKDLILDGLKDYKLIKITNFKERYLVLTFDKILVYYDTFLNTIYSKIKLLPTTGLLSELIRDKVVTVDSFDEELLTLLKQNGKFQIYTQWGNLQTEINISKFTNNQNFNYTSFSILDNLLIVSSDNGHIQLFDFYKQYKTSLTNFKSSSSYTLFNSKNNRINSFSNNHSFQYYLPTNSINNVISQLKYNGDGKFCLLYIANKNIVLLRENVNQKIEKYPEISSLPLLKDSKIHTSDQTAEMELGSDGDNEDELNMLGYDGWLVFDNMDVSQIEWVDNRYAFLQINDLENSNNEPSIVCLDLKKLDSNEGYRLSIVHLLELRIWTYRITNEDEVLYWGCNTFANMVKFLKTDGDNKELLKLGEFNVLLRNKNGDVRLETIDVLINGEDDQVRSFVRNTIDLSKLPESSISYERNVKWIYHCYKGIILVYTGDDELHKITVNQQNVLTSDILYTKLEEIVEMYGNKITFVRGSDLISCDIDMLTGTGKFYGTINERKIIEPLLEQSLVTFPGEYPIMIDKNLVEFDSLKCNYSSNDDVVNGFKLTISKNMILDKIIARLLKDTTNSVESISLKYNKSKYYQFCLERLLCENVVNNVYDDIYEKRVLEIIELFDNVCANSKLELYVNCIRKIDYDQVFKLLKLIGYSSIDSFITEILKIDDLPQKCTLLSKIIITKFNIDLKVDKNLLETIIKLLVENANQNSSLENFQNCYKIMHQLITFTDKFNDENEASSIDKTFIIDLIETVKYDHVTVSQ